MVIYLQYEFSETRFRAIYVEMSMIFREYYALPSKSLFTSNRSQNSHFITPIDSHFHYNSNGGTFVSNGYELLKLFHNYCSQLALPSILAQKKKKTGRALSSATWFSNWSPTCRRKFNHFCLPVTAPKPKTAKKGQALISKGNANTARKSIFCNSFFFFVFYSLILDCGSGIP